MKQPPVQADQTRQSETVDTIAALVQMLVDAGIQPGKIKASLTKAAKPGHLVTLEKCLLTLPKGFAQARRA